MNELRVATYNIRHGAGTDERLDLSRTARAINDLAADVVGLQEVDDQLGDRSAFEDQTARLGELTGMRAVFGPVIDRGPGRSGGRRRYGLALLSRHEIAEHRLELLPAHPGRPAPREPRGVLVARLMTPAPLHVLVTHLDNRNRAHRAAQMLGILRLAASLEGPAVLSGDMNADPSAPELAPLGAAGWRDAAREAEGRAALLPPPHPLALLTTALLRRPRPTFPAVRPRRRIDSIWVRDDIRVDELTVGATTASDHRPVVAALRL